MKLMKRLMALMLMLCMLPAAPVLAEEDADAAFGDSIVIDTTESESAEEEDDVFIPEDNEELAAASEILDAEIDDTVQPGKLDLNENLPDNVVNILLVGIDGRTDDLEKGTQHGDVQIIVSINKDEGTIKLTSVLRDLYVTIPGYKSKNRINVAYSRGGGQLAMRTMNNLLELNIQHYVAINFYGLASIIDSLGGIDIELTKTEANAINTYLRKHPPAYDNQEKGYKRQNLEKKAGVQHLDGVQAVMYARLRSIDNDFKRSERQRHLLELLLAKVLDGGLDMDKLLNLLEVCLPYAKTNMKTNELFMLALDVLQSGILEKLESGAPLLEQSRVPVDETWKYYTTDAGASVVSFRTNKRQQENVEAIHNFIYGEYIPAE